VQEEKREEKIMSTRTTTTIVTKATSLSDQPPPQPPKQQPQQPLSSQGQPQQPQVKRPLPLGHIATLYAGKGGSGKTTTTFHLAAALLAKGYRVLLVDWDGGQASLTAMAGVDPGSLQYGLYEAIKVMLDNESLWLNGGGGASPSQHHQQALRGLLARTSQSLRWLGLGLGQGQVVSEKDKRFAIIGNNLELASLETELADMTGREYVLKKFLARYSPQFDFTLIDPPANRGLLTVNALTASDTLILPIETNSLSFQATCSMLAHPRFLEKITGRNWEEEMKRMLISSEAWNANALYLAGKKPAAFTSTSAAADRDENENENGEGAGAGIGIHNTTQQNRNQEATVADADVDADADADDNGLFGTGSIGGQEGGMSLLFGQAVSAVHYPNARLTISAVIPTRYDHNRADNRDVLARLEAIFGKTPANGGRGRLMMPVPDSGTYQRSFSTGAVAQKVDSKRHGPIWNYTASYVAAFAAHLLQKQQS
jgi:cellulose biosynthesis protein BcsQ